MSDKSFRHEAEIRLTNAAGESAARPFEFSTAQPNVTEAVKELRQRIAEALPKNVHPVSDQE